MGLNRKNIEEILFRSCYNIQKSYPNNHLSLIIFLIIRVANWAVIIDINKLGNQSTRNQVSSQNFIRNFQAVLGNYIHFFKYEGYEIMDKQYKLNLIINIILIGLNILLVVLSSRQNQTKPIVIIIQSIVYFWRTFTFLLTAFIIASIKKAFLEDIPQELALSIISAFMFLTINHTIVKFSCTCMAKNQGAYDKSCDLIDTKKYIIMKIIVAYTILKPDYQQIQALIMCSVLIITLVVKLLIYAYFKEVYYSPLSAKIIEQKYIILICFFSMLSTSQYIQILRENLLVAFVSFYVWFSIAHSRFKSSGTQQLAIKNVSQVKSEIEAIALIRVLYRFYKNYKKTYESLLLSSLTKFHKAECNLVGCECHNWGQNNKISSSQFLKTYFKLMIGQFEEKFSDFSLTTCLLSFRVEVLEEYPQYFMKNYAGQEKEDIIERYYLFQIRQQARKSLSLELRNKVDNRAVCEQEQFLNTVAFGTIETFDSLYRIFNHLTQKHIDLGVLNNLLIKNFLLVKKNQRKFQNFRQQTHHAIKPVMLLLYYYRNVIKIRKNVFKLMQMLKAINRRIGNKKQLLNNFQTDLFSHNGCVLSAVMQSGQKYTISTASNNAQKVFGYLKNEIIGMNIGKILPRIFREQHDKILDDWIETGKMKNISQILDVVSIDSKDTLFTAKIKLQAVLENDILKIYLGIVKINDQDYMIVSSDHLVEHFGESLKKIFAYKKFCSMKDIAPIWEKVVSKLQYEDQVQTDFHFTINQDKNNGKNNMNKVSREFHGDFLIKKIRMRQSYGYLVKKISFAHNKSIKNCDILTAGKLVSYDNQNQICQENPESDNFKNFLEKASSINPASTSESYSLTKIFDNLANIAFTPSHQFFNHLYLPTMVIAVLSLLIVASMIFIYVFQMNKIQSIQEYASSSYKINHRSQIIYLLLNKINDIEHCQYSADKDGQQCSVLPDVIDKYLAYYNDENFGAQESVLDEGSRTLPNLFRETTANLKMHGTEVQIYITSFWSHFHAICKKIVQAVRNKQYPNKFTDKYYQHLFENEKGLLNITKESMNKYEAKELSEVEQIVSEVIIIVSVPIVMMGLLVLTIYLTCRNENKFRKGVLDLFLRIPCQTCVKLSGNYKIHRNIFDLDRLDEDFLRYEEDEDEQSVFFGEKTVQQLKGKLSTKIFIGTTIISSITVLALIIFFLLEFIPISENYIRSENNMMRSETKLLSSLVEIEFYFSLHKEVRLLEQYDTILEKLSKNSNDYIQNIQDTLESLEIIDKEFEEQLEDIVTQNVCTLIERIPKRKILNLSQQQCNKFTKLKILQEGLLISMNFCQRTMREIAVELWQFMLSGIKKEDYFSTLQMQELEGMLDYLFVIFNYIHIEFSKHIDGGFTDKIRDLAPFLIIYSLIALSCALIWCLSIRKKRSQKAEALGFLLIYPVEIVYKRNFIYQAFKKII